MNSAKQVVGGIDAGGTTFKCGVADESGTIIEKLRVPVTTPEETLQGCSDFFKAAARETPLRKLGIASFGPIDVDPTSEAYGTILTTPKPKWSGTNLKAYFDGSLGVQTVIDTDVNGALLAEMTFGAAKGAGSSAYITIGTGIGAGLFANGGVLGRPSHPEFGHIPLRRHPEDRDFEGVCPFHGDCLEGLASVTAMRGRWGEPKLLQAEHDGWPIIAHYLAQACRVLTLTLRLDKIVLGGGLMLAPHLLKLVQEDYNHQMAGYLGEQAASGAQLIATPALGDDAGLIGALYLARQRPGN